VQYLGCFHIILHPDLLRQSILPSQKCEVHQADDSLALA